MRPDLNSGTSGERVSKCNPPDDDSESLIDRSPYGSEGGVTSLYFHRLVPAYGQSSVPVPMPSLTAIIFTQWLNLGISRGPGLSEAIYQKNLEGF